MRGWAKEEMYRKSNQRGFSVVELFLVIVIVGLLGFIGWAVWHAKQNTSKVQPETQQAATNTTEQSPQKSDQKYLTIKEWGVQIAVPSSVPDLIVSAPSSYTTTQADGKPGGTVSFVTLSTPAFNELSHSEVLNQCGPQEQQGLGVIDRVLPNTPTGIVGFATFEDYAASPNRPGLQVGKYFYVYDQTNACFSSETGGRQLFSSKQVQDIANTFSNSLRPTNE